MPAAACCCCAITHRGVPTIAGKSGVDDWVERLARVIEPFMTEPEGQMNIDETTTTELEATSAEASIFEKPHQH